MFNIHIILIDLVRIGATRIAEGRYDGTIGRALRRVDHSGWMQKQNIDFIEIKVR